MSRVLVFVASLMVALFSHADEKRISLGYVSGKSESEQKIDQGIGCYLYEITNISKLENELFISDWVNINGRNIELQKVTGEWPCCKIGSQSSIEYEASELHVKLVLHEDTECEAEGPCYSNEYSGKMIIEEGGVSIEREVHGSCSD